MSIVADAAVELETVLKTVDGLRVHRDPGADVSPPAAIIGPPALLWEAVCNPPTSATFLVYVVESRDSRSLERLWDLAPAVADQVDSDMPSAVVTRADPGTWATGSDELPAYILRVEVGL